MTSDNAKQGIFTYRQKKASCEALPGPAAQREAEMMNQSLQARCPARERAGYRYFKPFDEDPLTTIGKDATEPAGQNLDPNQFALGRQVSQQALIPAVDTARKMPTGRTGCRF
jgi:hypothetical protein